MTTIRIPPSNDEILLPALPSEVRGWGRFKRIMTKFPAEPLEVYGAIGMVAVGVWFLWPDIEYPTGGVLHAIYNSHTYRWGYVLLVIGLYKFWAILYGYENRVHRLIAACAAGGAFSLILAAFLRVQPHNWMVVIMSVWILQQGWIAYRSQRSWRSK